MTIRASVRLNYDDVMEKIVFDHVVPPTEQQNGAWFTYLPDGTYEGFEWQQNHWEWLEKMFHFSIGLPDSPPLPHPILDDRD
ncbi:MAG: hypothetical protein LRY27_00135 [Chitinophagales bacterium]|nr:hypothetical protein [Chitinophagales bacterium]